MKMEVKILPEIVISVVRSDSTSRCSFFYQSCLAFSSFCAWCLSKSTDRKNAGPGSGPLWPV